MRQVTASIFLVMAIGTSILGLNEILYGANATVMVATIGSATAFWSMLLLYHFYTIEQVRYAAVILTTGMVIFAQQEPFVSTQISLSILIPPIMALLIAGPGWIVGGGLCTLAGLIIRAHGDGIYANVITIVLYCMALAGLVLFNIMSNIERRVTESANYEAQTARRELETQTAELRRANIAMGHQIEQKSRLLELVQALETPIIPLATGVLLAPIVGHVDSLRATAITERLLNVVSDQRAELTILDVSGVAVVDSAVAQSLGQTVQAIELLGCQVMVTGISATVAATMVQIGVDLRHTTTIRSPQQALVRFLGKSENGASKRI